MTFQLLLLTASVNVTVNSLSESARKETLTDSLPVWVSPGWVSGRSHPAPASGEHRAGQPAEETRELLQHIRGRVQPEPAVGSPGSYGCGVSPSFL